MAPFAWTITSGSLPAGLSLSFTGIVSGTPTATGGPDSASFEVSDSANSGASATLSITVAWDDK